MNKKNVHVISKNQSFVSQEMLDIMKAIYDMMGKWTYPILKEETPRQHVEIFFQVRRLFTTTLLTNSVWNLVVIK